MCTDSTPQELAGKYTQYGPLKTDTGEAVVEMLRPIQKRYNELMTDRGELASLLQQGLRQGDRSGRGDGGPGLRRDRLPAPLIRDSLIRSTQM